MPKFRLLIYLFIHLSLKTEPTLTVTNLGEANFFCFPIYNNAVSAFAEQTFMPKAHYTRYIFKPLS